MLRKWFDRLLVGVLALATLAATTSPIHSSFFAATSDVGAAPIRLSQFTFDPIKAEPDLTRLSAMLRSIPTNQPNQPGLYLLQFDGTVTDAWKAEVQKLGARLYGYIPEHAFIARRACFRLELKRICFSAQWRAMQPRLHKGN